jgi:hypothetical protein
VTRLALLLALAACDALPGATGDDGAECNSDDDCGDHAICEAGACECVAGYDRLDGATCTWGGVVGDPRFITGAVWSLSPGLAIDGDYTNETLADPGAAVFTSIGRCSEQIVAYPTARQTLTMPRYSRAEPLAIEVSATGINSAFVEPDLLYGAAVVTHRGAGSSCLGAGAYAPESSSGVGVAIPFAIDLEAGCTMDPSTATVLLDHVFIAPADPAVCPAVGSVLGHADDDGGWQYTQSFDDTVGFAPGIGENGTPGLELVAAQPDSPIARTSVSVPVGGAAGDPSLRLYRKALATEQAYLTLSERPDEEYRPIQLPVSDDRAGVDTYCLPAGTFGTVVPFQATLRPPIGSRVELDLDNVAVQPDPACGTDPHVADPGFESGYVIAVVDQSYGILRATVDPDAHGGTQDLQLGGCGPSSATIEVVPTAEPNTALQFWYRASTDSITLNVPTLTDELVGDGSWHTATTCLTGGAATPVEVTFQIVGRLTGDECDGWPILALDDLALTTDPRCGSP